MQELLHIGKNTALRLVQSGEIEAFRVGKQWRVLKESVAKYIYGEWNNISKARITERNKSLTKFMYKYAFLSKGNYQCILTSDPGYDTI